MPNIDVVDILTDPDIANDVFQASRAQQIIDSNGRVTAVAPRVFPNLVGSVQPMSGRTLNMMPDMVNVSGAIEIWTQFRLEGPSDTTQADVVTWNGRDYLVVNAQSYTNYGRGFVHAVCQLMQLVASSPNSNIITSGP
jgi:hypothetical protein